MLNIVDFIDTNIIIVVLYSIDHRKIDRCSSGLSIPSLPETLLSQKYFYFFRNVPDKSKGRVSRNLPGDGKISIWLVTEKFQSGTSYFFSLIFSSLGIIFVKRIAIFRKMACLLYENVLNLKTAITVPW